MYLLQKSSRNSPARHQINIRGAKDGILVLPGGEYRKVLCVSTVNFELKSEDEQDALIETYESFLNSLDCPLQILIRTRELDMDKYLTELTEHFANETEPTYQAQLRNYDEFVRSLITTNKILTRNFYVVTPYTATSKLDFDLVQEQLSLRVDIISKGLTRLGMQSYELDSLEVLDLFYSFYNPEQAKCQPLTEQAFRLLNNPYVSKEEPV